MWLLDIARDSTAAVWSVTKKIVAPVLISTARIIASAGQSIFIVPKFVQYITNVKNHPAGFYTSIATISFSTIINLTTRIPLIFHGFNRSSNAAAHSQDSHTAAAHVVEKDELGCVGKTTFLGLSTFCWASSAYNLLNTYLSTMAFYEFICANMLSMDENEIEEESNQICLQAASAVTAILAIGAVIIYNVKSGVENARIAGRKLENRDFPNNRYAYTTMLLAILGLAPLPFTSFYNTSNALDKIPSVRDIDSEFKDIIAIGGSISVSISSLLTLLPALYQMLTNNKSDSGDYKPKCLETPLKLAVRGAGIGDGAATIASNFTRIVLTVSDKASIDEKSVPLIASAIPFAISGAILNYAFSVEKGLKDTINLYRHSSNDPAYTLINNDEPDIETDSVNETTQTTVNAGVLHSENSAARGDAGNDSVYSKSNIFLLFGSAPETTEEIHSYCNLMYQKLPQ
jgi:hypothetical protein